MRGVILTMLACGLLAAHASCRKVLAWPMKRSTFTHAHAFVQPPNATAMEPAQQTLFVYATLATLALIALSVSRVQILDMGC